MHIHMYISVIIHIFASHKATGFPLHLGTFESKQKCWRRLPMGRHGSFQEVLQPDVSKKKEHTAHSEGQYEVGHVLGKGVTGCYWVGCLSEVT